MRLSGKKWLDVPGRDLRQQLRSIPLVMVILWFFLLIPLLIGRPIGAELLGDHHLHRVRGGVLLARSCAPASSRCRAARSRAGYAVGMTYAQSMRFIVLPQAFRNMLPVLLTQTIILFQDTSLVYAIGAYDLLKGFEIAGKNFNRPVEMLPARRRRLLRHLLQPVDARAPAAEEDRHHPLRRNRPNT